MRFYFYSPLIIFALFFGCSSKTTVTITDKNFGNEIEQQTNLTLTFNHDLVPDSLVGVWDTTTYLDIQPKVKGKFKWDAKNVLVFSPLLGFAASTDYQLEVTNSILDKTKEKLKIETEKSKISFHTAYLGLVNGDFFWTKNNGRTELRSNLTFNYKINPAELNQLLKVEIDNRVVAFQLNTTQVGNVVQLVFVDNVDKLDNKTIKLMIEKGLTCQESSYITPEPITYESIVPDKSTFQIVQVVPEYLGEEGVIHVYTNQSPESNQNFKGLVVVDPISNIKVEILEYGFLIKGGFKSGSTLQLTISKDLQGIFGGRLGKDFQQYVVFGDLEPSISFASKKAIYLTNNGEKNIGINIINVPEVHVVIYKVYENNILQFLKASNQIGGGEGYYGEDEGYYESSNSFYFYGDYLEYGDIVLDKTIGTKSLERSGSSSLLNLNLQDINAFKGIYVVTVQSTEDQYLKDSKLVSISDIGLLVKESQDDIMVFANSILTANPLKGVEVSLISRNNQVVYKETSDGDGVAIFKDIKKKAPGFVISMVTSKLESDFNYLHFQQTKVDLSRFEIGGIANNPGGYQAFIFGDRNIYRPGEKVNLEVILRDDTYNPVSSLPIKIKILAPNGKEYRSMKGVLNDQGAFETSFIMPVSTLTGTYIAEVYSANDILLNSYNFSLEEFIPDRIAVKVNVSKPQVKLGESVTASATALNLFGPPAVDRNYEMEYSVKRKYFSPKGFGEYTFDLSGKLTTLFEKDLRQGKTSSSGSFSESFTIPETYKNCGLLEGKIFTTVFDESGRPVNRVNQFEVYSQDIFYGIKVFDSYVDTRQQLVVPLIALDKTGMPKTASAKVQLINYQWQTVLQKDDYGRFRYVSEKQERVMDDRLVSITGKTTTYNCVPTQSGEYVIRVFKPGTEIFVERQFYAYGWGNTNSSSFEVDKEGLITIEADKEKYEVGDEANLLFKTPFAGKLLVTVEQNNVLEYFQLETDKKSASLKLKIKDEFLPNVYISATLIRPLTNEFNHLPLTVAHGYLPLLAEKQACKMPIEIIVPETSRSQTKQTIKVKCASESNIEVTIAVVDEGILQIKNYETPDPYQFFFKKRRLEVSSYDIYPRLFPELKPSRVSFGADGMLQKRINPMGNKRVNLVAFWSGILKTNGNGEAFYTVDIPSFSGDLRIVAVAHKGNRFSSRAKNIKVADPIVLSTSLPRFISPGDSVLVPILVSNTTGAIAAAKVSIITNEFLIAEGSSQQNLKIPAKMESRAYFKLYTNQKIGQGEVKVKVEALGESFSDIVKLPVRPASPLVKKYEFGTISGAKRTSLASTTNDFILGSEESELLLSNSPLVQFGQQLKDLVQYPHGCIEQTVSTAFPQIYLQDLCAVMNPSRYSNPSYNVQEAIKKLNTMQLYNGAMTYWQGESYESWFGSIYAAHFLIECRKAGYEINNQVLDKLIAYIKQKVKERSTEVYYYSEYEGGVLRSRSIVSKEIPYSLYVLALLGKQDLATMNYYKSNIELLALDGRYLLAAAYMLSGDQAAFKTLTPKSFNGEISRASSGGSFYSYLRDEAIALNAIIDSDPKNPQITILSRHLSEQIKDRAYLSTQEQAFALLALGKVMRGNSGSVLSATVTVANKTLGTYEGNPKVFKSSTSNFSIDTKGSGLLYYFKESEGISASGTVLEEDKFIKVRRTFFDRNGQLISNNIFKQNDLIVVELSLTNLEASTIDNVVISDLLPAGFEIENPRISASPDIGWIQNAASPQYLDVRDDRINFYTSIGNTTKKFYYIVRAVSKGRFALAPAAADAMYNGEYHSYSGAGIIVVK